MTDLTPRERLIKALADDLRQRILGFEQARTGQTGNLVTVDMSLVLVALAQVVAFYAAMQPAGERERYRRLVQFETMLTALFQAYDQAARDSVNQD